MIKKYYEVSCDECDSAINHVTTMRVAKEEANKFHIGNKHFCNEICMENYKKKPKGK